MNDRDWPEVTRHVVDDVVYNDEPVGLSGYLSMLQRDTVIWSVIDEAAVERQLQDR